MEMDLSNIKPGCVYKNYNSLCAALGLKPAKSGKSKQLQIASIEQHIQYKKIGYAFEIIEVHNKPLRYSHLIPRRDRRKRRPKNIYIKFVQLLIMQHLVMQENNGVIEASKINLFKLLGMVNHKFNVKSYETYFLSQYKEIDNLDQDLAFIKSHTYRKLNSILESALYSLESQRLITQTTVISVHCSDGTQHDATDEEIQLITAIEHDVMESMGLREYWQIFSNNCSEKFYAEYNQRISEFGWQNTIRNKKIIFTREIIVKALSKKELEFEKILLNEEIIEFLKDNLQEKHTTINSNAIFPQLKNDSLNHLFTLPFDEFNKRYELVVNSFIKYLCYEESLEKL